MWPQRFVELYNDLDYKCFIFDMTLSRLRSREV